GPARLDSYTSSESYSMSRPSLCTESETDPEKSHLVIGDMSAGQRNGPLQREGPSITQPPLPPEGSPFRHCAAAGNPQVGLRPSLVTPAAAQCHPDCRSRQSACPSI
ncbi:MAG TPA: hypothetical protein VIE65_19115, partial [Methylobacter sp.]